MKHLIKLIRINIAFVSVIYVGNKKLSILICCVICVQLFNYNYWILIIQSCLFREMTLEESEIRVLIRYRDFLQDALSRKFATLKGKAQSVSRKPRGGTDVLAQGILPQKISHVPVAINVGQQRCSGSVGSRTFFKQSGSGNSSWSVISSDYTEQIASNGVCSQEA